MVEEEEADGDAASGRGRSTATHGVIGRGGGGARDERDILLFGFGRWARLRRIPSGNHGRFRATGLALDWAMSGRSREAPPEKPHPNGPANSTAR